MMTGARMPGFTADNTFSDRDKSYHIDEALRATAYRGMDLHQYSGPMIKAALIVKTMPPGCYQYCQTEIIYEPCGSAPDPETPPPMCPAGTTEECHWECPEPTVES